MKTKIESLKIRLDRLNDRLFEAKIKENERVKNMGWGYGMRHSKIGFSTRTTDNIKEKIKEVTEQIKQLEQTN